jgi:putative chitinase
MNRDQALAELSRARIALDGLEAALAPDDAPPVAAPQPPSAERAGGLSDPTAFYAALRASDAVFGGRLNQAQVEGCQAILQVAAGRLPLSWCAAVLGTAYHETGHTMQPVREKGSGDGADADPWDDYLEKYDTGHLAAALGNTPEADGDGIRWAGRGQVQLTGERNYRRANERLRQLGLLPADESLVDNPDLAMRTDVSAAILVIGCLEGWFTGKSLRHYLQSPATREQFVNSRRVVNGTDRAELIAGYCMAFQSALQTGGWS